MTFINIFSSAILTGFLIWLSINDIRNLKIPNISFPILLAFSFFINSITITARLLGILIALPFFVYACITDKLGGGDVKLIACIGFMLGFFYGAFAVTFAYFAKYIFLLFTIKRKHSSKLPFCPFLSGGIILCIIMQY